MSPDIHVDNIPPVEEPLPPYKIEYARSNRSKCKVCKKTIDKGAVRIGIKIEGPFGEGFLWNHLACAAKRDFEQVEEAYAGDFTAEGVERPPLEELRALAQKAEQQRAEKLTAPYVERAPSGRSKCHYCGEPIDQNAFRVVVLRSVEFYGQMRSGPIKVHPVCVAATLAQADSATEVDGFAAAVERNSRLPASDVKAALLEIGELGST